MKRLKNKIIGITGVPVIAVIVLSFCVGCVITAKPREEPEKTVKLTPEQIEEYLYPLMVQLAAYDTLTPKGDNYRYSLGFVVKAGRKTNYVCTKARSVSNARSILAVADTEAKWQPYVKSLDVRSNLALVYCSSKVKFLDPLIISRKKLKPGQKVYLLDLSENLEHILCAGVVISFDSQKISCTFERNISYNFCPVVNEYGELVGILSDDDSEGDTVEIVNANQLKRLLDN